MSTHATIWIKNSNDTFTGIYCHFDGYLSGVGDTLLKHYNVECMGFRCVVCVWCKRIIY